MIRYAAALVVLACFACTSPAEGPSTCADCAPGTGAVRVALAVTASDIGRVTATVSGPGVEPAISQDLAISGVPPVASGVIANVPVGASRTVTLEAWAVAPEEELVLYRGSGTIDVGPGAVSRLAVALLPVVKDLAVTATFPAGDVAVASVHHVAVTVTGARIGAPTTSYLAFDPASGVASGTVPAVPVGATRTVTVRAFDAAGALLHEGAAAVAVLEGAPAEALVTLASQAGTGYVDVSGEFCVPACASAVCGDDGCGGSCGGCLPGDECTRGVCGAPLPPPGPPEPPPPPPPLPAGWTVLRETADASPCAIWGSGPSDVWLWSLKLGAASGSLMEHWDGSAWTEVPGLPVNARINAIWGSASDDVWAVGYLRYDAAPSSGVIFHWDGSAWSESTETTSILLDSVWGSGANDVWAAGHGLAIVLHWDGNGWSTVATGTGGIFNGLWGSGPDDVWGAGPPEGIQHWNGSAWSSTLLVPTPSYMTTVLWDVWGSSSTDVWAVGNTGGNPHEGHIWHWNGDAWSLTRLGQYNFYGVTGTGPNDVWAIDGRVAAHYDGSAWTVTPLRPDTSIRDLWASGPNDLWVLGWDGSPPTVGLIFHYAP